MVSRSIIAALKDTLARHTGLELAIVFGSVARNAQAAHSDVDLAIQAASPLDVGLRMAMVAELAEATGRAIDLIDLRTVGEPLLGQILVHGRRLLGSDEAYAPAQPASHRRSRFSALCAAHRGRTEASLDRAVTLRKLGGDVYPAGVDGCHQR